MIGTSYEGRDIRVLKVCRDGCNEEKPAVYVQAGEVILGYSS